MPELPPGWCAWPVVSKAKLSCAASTGAHRVPSLTGQGVDAKSILSVLMLAATSGTQLEACAEGIDEEAAMNAIEALFADAFG